MGTRGLIQQALLAATVALFGGGGVVAACLDTTPTYLSPIDGAADQAADGGDNACLRCIEASPQPGPGCADSVEACKANQACGLIFLCSVAKGCFEKDTNESFISCGID